MLVRIEVSRLKNSSFSMLTVATSVAESAVTVKVTVTAMREIRMVFSHCSCRNGRRSIACYEATNGYDVCQFC